MNHRRNHPLRAPMSLAFGFVGAFLFGLQTMRNMLPNLDCIYSATSIAIYSDMISSTEHVSHLGTSPPPAKLADGCYHVFVDVGANIGVHARFLFEPEKYPNATLAKSWFDEAFGTFRDNRNVCVFAFEPNPKHKERLSQLQHVYQAMGWRYVPIFSGVSDHEGDLTFVASRDTLGRGFSARETSKTSNGKETTVPVVRLASWLQKEVHGRQIPPKPYGEVLNNKMDSNTTVQQQREPTVVMKLDVETLEFVVLPDLLLSGALCDTVNRVFGEVHYQFFPLEFHYNGLKLTKAKEAKAYFMSQLRLLEISPNCNTTWTTEDDESHSEDGMPFPVPDAATSTNTTSSTIYS